jgi:LmbE family N-acetylglucosaminyl deacetylase
MELSSKAAAVFCPDGRSHGDAFRSTRQLGVVAHADDLEIAAIKGILDCFDLPEPAFSGVVVCDGAGAPRQGPLSTLSPAEYRRLRAEEQQQAAIIGRYSAVIGLGHASSHVRGRAEAVGRDLDEVFRHLAPEIVYTHSPVDAHDTHVAVLLELIEALRRCPLGRRPVRVIGCEVWRDLDWLPDARRVALDVGARAELQAELLSAFASQIGGGKRYDLAVMGRRRAHATFARSDEVDQTSGIAFGVDLTPLIEPGGPDVIDFTLGLVGALRDDVEARLARLQSGHS